MPPGLSRKKRPGGVFLSTKAGIFDILKKNCKKNEHRRDRACEKVVLIGEDGPRKGAAYG